jgi:hypothetical protein
MEIIRISLRSHLPRTWKLCIGRKNKIIRRWAKRGTRPIAPRDQRTASTYIFGAVCPKQRKGAALILPTCNTEAMNLHLAEIAATVRTRRPRHPLGRPDRLAHVDTPDRAGQHHHHSIAAKMPRAQSGRKRLAVPSRVQAASYVWSRGSKPTANARMVQSTESEREYPLVRITR